MRIMDGLTEKPKAPLMSRFHTHFQGCLVLGVGRVLVDEMTTTLPRC